MILTPILTQRRPLSSGGPVRKFSVFMVFSTC